MIILSIAKPLPIAGLIDLGCADACVGAWIYGCAWMKISVSAWRLQCNRLYYSKGGNKTVS